MSDTVDGVALVTGGSSGIGLAVATELAARGMTVCISGRDSDRLNAAVVHIDSRGGKAILHPSDLSTDEGIRSLAHRITSELGRLDVLVHSAGNIILGDIESAEWNDLDLQYRINLRAPFLLTKALLPLLKTARGQVVFVNSSAGLIASAENGLYSATKRALHSLADSVRGNVNAHGIRVLSVFPGRTATPMQEGVYRFEGRAYDPSGLIRPGDVADLIVHALELPRNAEITDIMVRPSNKPAHPEHGT